MKLSGKTLMIIGAIVLAVLILLFPVRFVISGPEDAWICDNSQWIKHGMPDAPIPSDLCK